MGKYSRMSLPQVRDRWRTRTYNRNRNVFMGKGRRTCRSEVESRIAVRERMPRFYPSAIKFKRYPYQISPFDSNIEKAEFIARILYCPTGVV